MKSKNSLNEVKTKLKNCTLGMCALQLAKMAFVLLNQQEGACTPRNS